MKKPLRKNLKDYQNVRLYVTESSASNQWCTGGGNPSPNERFHDKGTVACS